MTLLSISGFPGTREIPCYAAAVWRALISPSSKFNTCVGSFVVDAGTRGFVDLDSSQEISHHHRSRVCNILISLSERGVN